MTAPGASCGRRCRIMSLVLAGLAGGVFGAGLLLSGMTDPARVVGFLDVTRRWDPTLAFVMASAVAVYAVAFRWIRGHRAEPWFDTGFHLPSRRDIDPALVIGAALFGAGWGLVGVCPGPAIVAAASGCMPLVAFVIAMVAGMKLAAVTRRSHRA